MGRASLRLRLLGLGLLVALAGAELLLRLFPSPIVGVEHQPLIYRGDAALGFRYVPGAVDRIHRNFEIDNEVRINAAGFHDVEHRLNDGGRRIVVLGDSMTAGLQVPASRTWTQMLQSDLRAIGTDLRGNVVNLGVDGTGPRYHLAILRELAADLAPDLVIVAVCENDTLDLIQPMPYREVYRGHVLLVTDRAKLADQRAAVDRQLERDVLRRLHRASYLFRAGAYLAGGRHSLFRTNFVRPRELVDRRKRLGRPDATDAWRQVFAELGELARSHGFDVLIVPVPARDDAEATVRMLDGVSENAGLASFDPLPLLREQLRRDGREHRDMYWRDDGHLNAYGHRTLAKAIALGATERLVPDFEQPIRRLVSVSRPERFLVPTDGFEPTTAYTIARAATNVRFAIYPVPASDKTRPHWGHWGTGTVHPNGKVYGIVGNHLGRDGEAFLYQLDPPAGELRRVADLQAAVGKRRKGDFGFGKVHGRVDHGSDGRLYLTSWGGNWRHDPEHPGSRMFVFDPATAVVSDLGVLVPRWGTPSTRLHRPSMRYYAEYLSAETDDADFLVYDIDQRRVVFRGGHDGVARGRDFFVDGDGKAYYNNGDGRIEVYDPESNSVRPFPGRMPGEMIRRTTGPDAAGRMYGATLEEHVLFSLQPSTQSIEVLTDLWSQTATLALDANGGYLYYVAGSNVSETDGTQLVQIDLDGGATQKVIAFLDAVVLDEFGYRAGRTGESGISPVDSYNLTISEDGGQLYLALNGTMAANDFERAALLVIDVPASERSRRQARTSPGGGAEAGAIE